ncbi:hypothetical protein K438DRAFT_1965351 [Mycena galopus ATCC 62051]|nr:hypothetical protein K438DRAFT_1965351 [Mycena galopus ATCC 62051]
MSSHDAPDYTDANLGQKADPAKSNVTIGIMGSTGTGKSSFILRLTGDKSIKIGHGVESATSKIGQHTYVDEVTDTDILRQIVTFLHEQYSEDNRLGGVIYFHRITDARLGGVGVRNLRLFRKLCGEEATKNVVVVTTRWDDVQEKDRGAGMTGKELMETPGIFFQPLIAGGARFQALLENQPIPLKVQVEMRDGKTLEETEAAGAELAAERKKVMDRHSAEMKSLKEELAEGRAALKRELEAERARMQEKMAKLEEQTKALAAGLTATVNSRKSSRKSAKGAGSDQQEAAPGLAR